MATKHYCDRCGGEVKSREDFWYCDLQPVNPTRDIKGYKRMELCPKCKNHIFVELHEYRPYEKRL